MLVKQQYILEPLTQLIQQCIAGNRAGQNELYKLFAPKMFALCLRYCRNREEAEEILQEGFVQVFKSLKKFSCKGSFEGWVRRIMVHCAIQQYHSRSKVYPMVSIEKMDSAAWEDENAMDIVSTKELLKMVQALSPAFRMVFNLFVFEGLKHREIAQLLGISEGTSKSNLFDAKLILQKTVSNSLKVAR